MASDGIVLYTEGGNPVRVTLMDGSDTRLKFAANPETGVYGYENEDTRITMMLEKP